MVGRQRGRRKVYDRGGARDTPDPSAWGRRHVGLVCVRPSFCQKIRRRFPSTFGLSPGCAPFNFVRPVGPFMPTPTTTIGPDETLTSPAALTEYFRGASKPRA